MEELDFLLKSDSNIIEAEIVDVMVDGELEVGLSLMVGENPNNFNDSQTLKQYEILLTEKEIKRVLSLIQNYY